MTESAPVIAKLAEMVRTIVTQAIASAIPSTDNVNRSGLRRMLASAKRTRHESVLPDSAAAIAGARVDGEVCTTPMVGSRCFARGDMRCPRR